MQQQRHDDDDTANQMESRSDLSQSYYPAMGFTDSAEAG